ncbi:MAG: hypothetical protein ACP6IP_03155 [Candidatus Njordarchaeia archaeon]
MRIAVFSRWNATCGVSLHAELLVREWIRIGHVVDVYAPFVDERIDWHHKKIDVEDEPWVHRVYRESQWGLKGGEIDVGSVDDDYDVVLIESYPHLPYREILRLVDGFKKRAKIFVVIHEGRRFDTINLAPLIEIVDGVFVFDFRFISEVLADYFDLIRDKVHIVPYPILDKTDESFELKKERSFGDGGVIFFSYGRQPVDEYRDYVGIVKKLHDKYGLKVRYKIMRSDGLLGNIDVDYIEQWQERPPFDKIYNYLLKSDIHLLPKGATRNTVVSSTVYQSLSTLTPIVAPATRHFELLPEDEEGIGPVVKYRNLIDLEYKLLRLINDERYRDAVVEEMVRFVRERSHRKIAKKFLEIFKE